MSSSFQFFIQSIKATNKYNMWRLLPNKKDGPFKLKENELGINIISLVLSLEDGDWNAR